MALSLTFNMLSLILERNDSRIVFEVDFKIY